MDAYRLVSLTLATLLVAVVALIPPDIGSTATFAGSGSHASRPATAPDAPGAAAEPGALDPEAERARIREHLLGAERQLVRADVSHLSEAQRERRARLIELLREYRAAGVFPHNHDFPGRRLPYFVDRHGTPCAMAYLIAQSGGEAIVERVARTANNAYVADLASDPAFLAWLDRHGMSVAEAARVQPTYDCCYLEPEPEANETDRDYALATAGNAVLSGAAIALQFTGGGSSDTWRDLLGLAAGGIGIGLGASRLDGDGGDADLAIVNVGLGAATLGTVAWRMLRRDDAPPPTIGARSADGLSMSARPALMRDGGAGVRFTLRF